MVTDITLEYKSRLYLVTPVDKKDKIKFCTEKCGFKILSAEKDGNVELVRFVLER